MSKVKREDPDKREPAAPNEVRYMDEIVKMEPLAPSSNISPNNVEHHGLSGDLPITDPEWLSFLHNDVGYVPSTRTVSLDETAQTLTDNITPLAPFGTPGFGQSPLGAWGSPAFGESAFARFAPPAFGQSLQIPLPVEASQPQVQDLVYQAVVIDLNDPSDKGTSGPSRWMLEAHAWIDSIPYTWVYQLEHGQGARPAMWSRGYLSMDPDGSWKWKFLFYEAPPGSESAVAAIQEYLAQDARSATRGTPTGESPLVQMSVPDGNQQSYEPRPITFYPPFAAPQDSAQSQDSHEGFLDETEGADPLFGERNYYPADSKYLPAMKKLEAKLSRMPWAPVYIRPRRLMEKKVAVDDGYGKLVADRIQQLLSQHLGKRHRAQVLDDEVHPRVQFGHHRDEARMATKEQPRSADAGTHLGERRQEFRADIKLEPRSGAASINQGQRRQEFRADIKLETRSGAASINQGERRQEVPADVKSEQEQEQAVAASQQVRNLKRGAEEQEDSEPKKKARRVSSDTVPVPTAEQIAAILPSISRFDGGIEATAIPLENGSIRCSACNGVYKDRSRWQRHAGLHRNGTVQCPFRHLCLSERKFGRWDHFHEHLKQHHQEMGPPLQHPTVQVIYSSILKQGARPSWSKLGGRRS